MVEGLEPADRRGERVLFTPGPLTTSASVKRAMQIDIGSRDADCLELIAEIRAGLVALAAGRGDLTCTLLQGSGSFAVEATIGSCVPRDGKLLVLANGAYGERIRRIAEALGIDHAVARDPEDRPHDPERVDAALAADAALTHVACVHCETTTGILNPLAGIGRVVRRHGKRLVVDAVSSFGAYAVGPGEAIDFDAGPIDHLIGSPNKCLQGVPGFAFVLSRAAAVAACAGNARSLCLDLHDQWRSLEAGRGFRYTPPTHVLLAFRQALRELEAEGGVAARAARYRENQRVLVEGMARLGFAPLVAAPHRSRIITTFAAPPGLDCEDLHARLRARGYVIYPGKLTEVETFRIATIGAIGPEDVRGLLAAIGDVAR